MKRRFKAFITGFLVLNVLQCLAELGEATIIQDGLPVNDLSQYTIRYLSETEGSDTDSCLSNQTYPPDSRQDNTTTVYCGSLIYALTGGYMNKSSNVSHLVVIILPGNYSMGEGGIEIDFVDNIFLTKMPGASREVIIKCSRFLEDSFNNLFLQIGRNISMNGIVFSECGSYGSPVRIQHTLNATISNCTFRYNRNCGLTLDRCELILIINSLFHDNNSTAYYRPTEMLDPAYLRFGGGLSMSWRESGNLNASKTAVVKNCTFSNNHADINVLNSNDTRPNFYRPRGHGGAIVVAFEGITNFTVRIEDTRIVENTAISSGGGMFVSFSDKAFNNRIIVKNCNFEQNLCDQDGSAISVNSFQVANDNTLIVENSTFDGNEAKIGRGACSVNLQDALVPKGTRAIANVAVFSSCNFTNNTSPTGGSAVNLVSSSLVNQAVATTNFTDCIFFGNKVERLRNGAITSFRFPISLSGTNVFKGNQGGGISLMQSRMDVDGTVLFVENSAMTGGGLVLEDQSLIHLTRDSVMKFIGNSAQIEGGAIYVKAPSVAIDFNISPIFNTGCFIQYEVNTEPFSLEPQDWNVDVLFVNNTAGRDGAAIYATSIDRCTYQPSYNTTNSNMLIPSIFDVSPPFTFTNNRVLMALKKRSVESLATAPSKLSVNLLEPQLNQSVAPGEVLVFNVTAFDEAGNQQAAIWQLNEIDSDQNNNETEIEKFLSLPIGGGNRTHTFKNAATDFGRNCSSGEKRTRTVEFSLVQVITGGVNEVSEMSFNITCCHPGYKFNEELAQCEIDDVNNRFIVRPHPRGRYFYAQSDLYVELSHKNAGTLTSAVIPPTFQHCSRDGIRPGCLVKFDLPDQQCSNERQGFLCGKCPIGKGVDLTLRQCKECTVKDAVLVAAFYVSFFVVSLLILFFNVRIHNELKGFLFFIQVVGFVYERSTTIDWDWHLSRVFGFSIHLPLCPKPGYNALSTTCYGFILSLLSIIAVVIYIISARFSKVLSNRSSFEGIWFLSIITYKFTLDTCFNLLRCQKVSGGDTTKFVYFYDGSITCFKSVHLAASIAALLGVVLVFLFPILILVISFRTFKFTQPFTDVLTKDIKVNCRWWSGFDLLRRLLYAVVVLFFNYVQPEGTQIALFFTGLTVYIIFAYFQPYKSRVANIVEALSLTILLLLTALFLNTTDKAKELVHPLTRLLLLLPFISFTIYITVKIINVIWKKVSSQSHDEFVEKMSVLFMNISNYRTNVEEVDTKTDTEQSFEKKLEDQVVRKFIRADYSHLREELLDASYT